MYKYGPNGTYRVEYERGVGLFGGVKKAFRKAKRVVKRARRKGFRVSRYAVRRTLGSRAGRLATMPTRLSARVARKIRRVPYAHQVLGEAPIVGGAYRKASRAVIAQDRFVRDLRRYGRGGRLPVRVGRYLR